MLFHLFQPAKSVRDHFAVLAGSLNASDRGDAMAGALRTLLLKFWPTSLLAVVAAWLLFAPIVKALTAFQWGPAAGLALGWLVAWSLVIALSVRVVGVSGLLFGLILSAVGTLAAAWCCASAGPGQSALLGAACAIALFVLIAFAVGLAGWRFATTLLRGLHGNFYGLCDGRTVKSRHGASGLTDWLTTYLDGLAGVGAGGEDFTEKNP